MKWGRSRRFLREEGDGEERAKDAGDGGDTKSRSAVRGSGCTGRRGAGSFAGLRSTSCRGSTTCGCGKAGVEISRLVSDAVGRRRDDWSVWRSNIASVRLGIGQRSATGDVNSDRRLEISITNFKSAILGVVGHIVGAAQTVINVLAVFRLICRGTRWVANGETERVSTNESVMQVRV